MGKCMVTGPAPQTAPKFEALDLESASGRYHTVTCLDVMIHYPQVRLQDWVKSLGQCLLDPSRPQWRVRSMPGFLASIINPTVRQCILDFEGLCSRALLSQKCGRIDDGRTCLFAVPSSETVPELVAAPPRKTTVVTQEKADAMISHLASLAEKRLILSFAPYTPYYAVLKRIGELFPGPSKVRNLPN